MMKSGGKAKLVCPSEVAYGDQGHQPTIPGGSTMVFEIELLSVASPAAEKEKAKDYVEKFSKEDGVKPIPVGGFIKTLKEGSGATPKAEDTVKVHYRGTFLDGTEFDSSYKRGQPATFTINAVIKGWQEALLLMKPGSKVELYIPPQLAYDQNSPPPIPPGSLLKFDVELISVRPAPPPGAPAPGGAMTGPKHPPTQAQ
jgi:FKBP-type peptidyl-prolyl cis-trans isomerase